jgi:hypothetical protein
VFDLTEADQEKFIGLGWETFRRAEPVVVSAAQPMMLG